MKNPTLGDVYKTLRPSYEPAIISSYADPHHANKELDGLHAIHADPAFKKLKIQQHTDSKKDALQKSIANDVYKDFCELTPEQMWPYWNEIKSSFERNTYK